MLKDIPLHLGKQAAVMTGDEQGLRTHHGALVDVISDERLAYVGRRPGLVEFVDLGTSAAVDGIFWWEKQNAVLAVSNGETHKITDALGVNAEIAHTDTGWAKGGRITFGDFETAIYGADGLKIKKMTTSSVIDTVDSQAPTTVSHVAVLNKFLLANNVGTEECHYPTVNNPDSWSSNFFSPETKNDDLLSVVSANQELYLAGDTTLEIFESDGSTPFVRQPGGFVQSGISAKYSMDYCPAPIKTIAWLDHSRQPVVRSGYNTQVMSGTLAKYIQAFGVVSDTRGDYMFLGGRPYYVWSFPSEGKTLVWDFLSSLWYEWGYWNESAAEYERWRGNCYCFSPVWNFSLVGDRANGKIYKVSNTTYTDDGDLIRSLVRTDHVDHGYPHTLKVCSAVHLKLKRSALASGSVKLMIRYRDNGKTTWSNQRLITLPSNRGESILTLSALNFGSYYTRQWELTWTDDTGLSIVQFQEDVN